MSYDFKGKRVFLSGPVSGLDVRDAIAAFGAAERAARDAGAEAVYNPAYLVPGDGELLHPHEIYMFVTLNELTDYWFNGVTESLIPFYDVLALLPGWEGSEGARAEKAVAEACGIEVIELGGGE